MIYCRYGYDDISITYRESWTDINFQYTQQKIVHVTKKNGTRGHLISTAQWGAPTLVFQMTTSQN